MTTLIISELRKIIKVGNRKTFWEPTGRHLTVDTNDLESSWPHIEEGATIATAKWGEEWEGIDLNNGGQYLKDAY